MTALDTNGPSIANEMRALAITGQFTAIALTYSRADNAVRAHRTLKAAFRSLASMIDSSRGKLNRRDFFAAVIVTPQGICLNWTEAKQLLCRR